MTGRGATTFSLTRGARTAVLAARGELDTVSVPPFRRALLEAVETGLPVVVVDLQQVTFLDSAALAVVFAAQRQLPPSRRLVLGEVPQRMLRTLRLAAVVSVVEVHPEGEPQPWSEDGEPGGAP